MAWMQRMKMRATMLLDRGRAGDRSTAELDHHIEAQTAENIAAGMSVGEARAAALRTFGNRGLVREQARATWSWNWVERLGRDIRIGMRTLARAPGFTMIAVLVMALGIGENVTIFAVVRAVLLNPLPFRDPGQLVAVYEHNKPNTTSYLPVAGASFSTGNGWQRARPIWRWWMPGSNTTSRQREGSCRKRSTRAGARGTSSRRWE
ncbi:permease prefix domain 1-containing protein [Tunturiibacter gelidiferens]|uniref:permease prefix domain 1-containing protein n=1 Tax=Tunturiibacter gelidiferens TaxID=3069689 RepID=UPI003D9B663C